MDVHSVSMSDPAASKQNSMIALASEIRTLRESGNIQAALRNCLDASRQFPDENFFYRIAGDLYLQLHDPENAAEAYLQTLRLLPNGKFYVFQKAYRNLEHAASHDFMQEYHRRILDAAEKGEIASEIGDELRAFLASGKDLIHLSASARKTSNDWYLPILQTWAARGQTFQIQFLIAKILGGTYPFPNKHNCLKVIWTLEKCNQFQLALKLIKAMPEEYQSHSTIAAAFRLCRKLSDYSYLDGWLLINEDFINRADFNIQYELVYYFQNRQNHALLGRALQRMWGSASGSLPIARTLYNFLLSLNRMEEAQTVNEHIQKLEQLEKQKLEQLEEQERKTLLKWRSKLELEERLERLEERLQVQNESEEVVREKIQELHSQQEHYQRMLAMSKLLKGFSHELGQPMSNIRLGVQLYRMQMEAHTDTSQDLTELIDMILAQTKRLDYLLKRLNPITSSKSEKHWFGILDCISHVRDDLKSHFQKGAISCELTGDAEIQLWGDPVLFSQIFFNLFLNAVQAMEGQVMEGGGRIQVKISRSAQNIVTIVVADNGPGIPKAYFQKIFDPFFTTKNPSSGNGGEGLGLYIVWNVLEMFNGRIHVDEKFHTGARFIMEIRPKEEGKSK